MAYADELTDEDFNLLSDALEAWENRNLPGEMMGDILTMMIGRSEKDIAALDAAKEKERAKRDREKRVNKERSIRLRAKLLAIRDRRGIDRLESSLSVRGRGGV